MNGLRQYEPFKVEIRFCRRSKCMVKLFVFKYTVELFIISSQVVDSFY